MTDKEIIEYVRRYQAWRRGEDTREWKECGLDSPTIGAAIDRVLALAERAEKADEVLANGQRLIEANDRLHRQVEEYRLREQAAADAYRSLQVHAQRLEDQVGELNIRLNGCREARRLAQEVAQS